MRPVTQKEAENFKYRQLEWQHNKNQSSNGIMGEWVFNEPGNMYACGYHYLICLQKEGEKIKELMVNLDCKEVRIGDEYYVFDPNLMASLQIHFQNVTRLH